MKDKRTPPQKEFCPHCRALVPKHFFYSCGMTYKGKILQRPECKACTRHKQRLRDRRNYTK